MSRISIRKGLILIGLSVWTALFPCNVASQYLFSRLGYEDGLSSKDITCAIEDNEGFIWFGTANGLNRFDGSTVKIYNHAHRNYPSSFNENIRKIIEYDPGSFLIGTLNGLVCFDHYHNQFASLLFPKKAHHKDGFLNITNLFKDPQDRIWIATNKGWFVYISGKIIDASTLFPELKTFDMDTFLLSESTIDKTRDGIWIGTTKGLRFFNYKTGTVWSYNNNPENMPVFRPMGVFGLHADKITGDLWWGDGRAFLNYYNAKNNIVQEIKYPGFDQRIFTSRKIYKDKSDRLWISIWQWALFVVEADGTLLSFPENSREPFPLRNPFINDFIETKDGDLWLASAGGAYKMSAQSLFNDILEFPEDNSFIYHFIRPAVGKWMLARETGITIYDERSSLSEHYKIKEGASGENRVFQIRNIGNEWWCATANGLKIFNVQSGQFSAVPEFPFSNEINSRAIIYLMQDSKGRVWISTWAGYIYMLDLKTNQCTRFDGSNPLHGDIGKTHCFSMMESKDGNIWMGHHNKGIRVLDDQRQTFLNPIKDSLLNATLVNNMVQDDQNNIWVSTEYGLYHLDDKGSIIKHYTTEDGLSSNLTNSVTIDPQQNIWVATPDALHYLVPGKERAATIPFAIENSMTDNWTYIECENRHCYTAVYDQIFSVELNGITDLETLAQPLITSVRIFEKELMFSPLHPNINLTHEENFFNIDYSSPQHRDNPSLQYEYKLENFSDTWVKNGRHLSTSYTNVPSGKYLFKIRTIEAGTNKTSSITSIPISITPPYWKTAWFYVLCGFLTAFILYQFYRFRVRRAERRKSDQIIDYFANAVYGENAVNEICWDIARNCISQLGFSECSVYLLDTERQTLIEKASFSPDNPKGHEIVEPKEIPVGSGIVGRVAPIESSVQNEDESFSAVDENQNSVIAVPIIHDQKVIGAIEARDIHKQFFTGAHIKTLNMIASISALKIADAKAEIAQRQNELKLLEINKLFTESQLKALRAQMNPHFVFNCLNSIQECIVTEKFSEASIYLNKFAKLFRQVLNNSGKMLITIEEEVELLKLYLELESMRFDHNFTYTIEIDPLLEADYVLVPSMLLQPFVENALWHGLMHKRNERILKINFKKINEEVFACIVEDNGIGRKESLDRKQTRGVTHKYESKGMKMIEERLDVLRRQNYHARLTIADTNGGHESDPGTKVIVELSTSLSNH